MQPTAERWPLRCLAIAALLLAAGCTGQTKLREAELDQLATWLPGVYDNRGQAEAERTQGHIVHEAVTLTIVPIYAPMLSDTVFYLHETASDDLRRVLTQRIVSFAQSKEGRIVETTWMFAEPTRWRDGERDPDLFKSLVPQDLTQVAGCDMVWHKAGDRFKGANDPVKCRTASRSTTALVSVATTADLGSEDLVLDQYVVDPSAPADASKGAGEFRFTKRLDASH